VRDDRAMIVARSWRRAGRLAGLAAALLAVAEAQTPATPQAPVQEPAKEQPQANPSWPLLTLQNLAPFARREIAAVVVPFANGAVPGLPDLHVDGHPTAWQPFGARWPDGSLRQALCLFPAEVQALGELQPRLVAGKGPPIPGEPIGLPPAKIEFVARTDAGEFRGELPAVEVLESNALRTVELRRARLGRTGLVAELIVQQGRGDGHAYADVGVFFSDPGSPAMQCAVAELAIESHGMALLLRHASAFGVQQTVTADGSRVVLLHDAVLGDGQGIRRCGALVSPLLGDGGIVDDTEKAAAVCPLLGAAVWAGTGAFSAYGEPAPLPPWLQGARLRAALGARHRAFVQSERANGDPFANGPLGLAKNAGQTGDQEDFGVVKLSVVAASGMPSFLLEVEASVLQEACRPVHMFTAEGAPLRAADRPGWVVWSGRTHWHPEVSKDRLGKPASAPPFETHGWGGKDREHWSTNNLGAFAQLTGAHWARRELQNDVQLYLAGQTLAPDLSTSHGGAPRGIGRTEQSASWMYLATGDQDLLQRMQDRIDHIYAGEWTGTTLGPDRVRPMAVQGPDARMLAGKTRYWTPWQDAIAAVGLGAAFEVTRDERARTLAEELALNVVRHGWLLTDRECIVATAIRWQDGEPLRPEQFGDADAVLWSYGTGFNEWALGACEIARVAATARGDTALAERAAEIQRRVRAGRTAPKDGFYDRLSEWDAVRWEAAPAAAAK
jgi:hypothetical protein